MHFIHMWNTNWPYIKNLHNIIKMNAVISGFGSNAILTIWAATWQNQQNECVPSIRPVWSESLLCASWVAKDPNFLHADSEDADQTWGMPRLIWVFAGHTLILLVLLCRGSFFFFINERDSRRNSRLKKFYFEASNEQQIKDWKYLVKILWF